MDKHQINMRMSEQLARLIDEKRMELARDGGAIPTRSDVVRLALAQFLQVDLSITEVDRRRLRS
jgi:Arc/MetJ-type ribon-helix-helix transcriptional regulator